jgi:DNA-binding CsgD family transcriptional regulator
MINPKLSFSETQDELKLKLLSLHKDHNHKKYDLRDVADFLPVGLLINHKLGANVFANRQTEIELHYTLDELAELGNNYQKTVLFNKEEFEINQKKIDLFYKRNDPTEIQTFFQRLKPKGEKDYRWMYVASKLFYKPNELIPQQRILIACPVHMMGDMTNKISRVLDENLYMKKNFRKFAHLTKREKEILTLIAQGYQNPDISEMLFISRHTVEKHRKNLKAKIECDNYSELIRFAQSFDMI